MRKFTLSAITCPILISLSSAAEVWAPGVSWEGGWYDFNKYAKVGELLLRQLKNIALAKHKIDVCSHRGTGLQSRNHGASNRD